MEGKQANLLWLFCVFVFSDVSGFIRFFLDFCSFSGDFLIFGLTKRHFRQIQAMDQFELEVWQIDALA